MIRLKPYQRSPGMVQAVQPFHNNDKAMHNKRILNVQIRKRDRRENIKMHSQELDISIMTYQYDMPSSVPSIVFVYDVTN